MCYVDDMFYRINEDQHPEEVLQKLNNLAPNIQFTFKMEIDSSINFLDCKLIKKSNKISTLQFSENP